MIITRKLLNTPLLNPLCELPKLQEAPEKVQDVLRQDAKAARKSLGAKKCQRKESRQAVKALLWNNMCCLCRFLDVYIYIYIYIYIYTVYLSICLLREREITYVCMYMYTYIYIYIQSCGKLREEVAQEGVHVTKPPPRESRRESHPTSSRDAKGYRYK